MIGRLGVSDCWKVWESVSAGKVGSVSAGKVESVSAGKVESVSVRKVESMSAAKVDTVSAGKVWCLLMLGRLRVSVYQESLKSVSAGKDGESATVGRVGRQ